MSITPTDTHEKPLRTNFSESPSARDSDSHGVPLLHAKQKRTVGLRIVDTLIYPVISNTAVFAASVALTYMTWHGEKIGAAGSTLRKISTAVQNRTKPIIGFFENLGMNEGAAKGFTTVLFSFVDGSIFAPLVKILEDRRETFAQKIDSALGTEPKNTSVYDAEPKQSWRSVLEGRLATSLIVVPTSIVMEKTGGNEAVLGKLGEVLNAQVEKSAGRKAFFTKALGKNIVLPDFFRIAAFEAFYTTVCTGGLYLISRNVARKHPPKSYQHATSAPFDTATTTSNADGPTDTSTAEHTLVGEKPSTVTSQFNHLERVVHPSNAVELTS